MKDDIKQALLDESEVSTILQMAYATTPADLSLELLRDAFFILDDFAKADIYR